MESKQDAIVEILEIAKRCGLTFQELEKAFKDKEPVQQNKASDIVRRLLGYLGAIFIFAGLAVFISLQWDGMNSFARIIITLGSGFVALLLGLTVLSDPRYAKAVTPLFIIAAVLQPSGMFVAFHEFSTGGDWRYASLAVTAAMAGQQGTIFWKKRRTMMLFTTLLFGLGFFVTVCDLLDVDEALIAVVLGFSLLCLSYRIGQSRHRVITPLWYFIGSISFLSGIFDFIKNTPFEILHLGISCFLVYISTYAKSRTLLVVSTLSILSYIGYFTGKHFADSIGWPITLILLGFILIGLSAVAFKINKRYIDA